VKQYDVAIVGAGMAGASLAAAVAPHASVLMLEAEDLPGYHSTGRSAAFWSESYGGPGVQPLTTASGPALREGGFLQDLGSLHIGRAVDEPAIAAFLAEFEGSGVALKRVDPHGYVPGLRPEWTLGVFEASSTYIDVAALHAHYLAVARRAGAELLLSAPLQGAIHMGDRWQVQAGADTYAATILVNAAGAWADQVARLAGVAPIGITAYQRTVVQLATDPPAPDHMPHIADISGTFYFKPEAGGKLWLSPHDETEVMPADVQPEELDVAIAIDRFEHVVDWRITRVERRWAGLRSFAPDRLPVYGFAGDAPGFFWCAGQGGFGIQTAPAAAALASAVLLGSEPDASVAGIDSARYAPSRFA
jgi:D-arginine dehydrogenase